MDAVLSWINAILHANITKDELPTLKFLHKIISLGTNEQSIDNPTGEFIVSFFERVFPFSLYDAGEIGRIQKSGDENEIYRLALLVLLGCLQTPSAVLFMDAALTLDVNTQREILHLIEEPMRCIQGSSPLTREKLLSTISLQPKSPESRHGLPGFAPVEFDQTSDQQGQPTPIKSMSVTEAEDCHSRIASQPLQENGDWISGRLPPDGVDLFRTGLGEPFTTSSPLVQDSSQARSVDRRKTMVPATASVADQPSSAVNDQVSVTTVPNHRRPTTLSVAVSEDAFLMPPPPPPPPPPPVSTQAQPVASGQNSPTEGSDSASFPAMSPLANIRNLVESPLWSSKIVADGPLSSLTLPHLARLREAERGLREMRRELAQSRAEREDAEHTCMELRREVAACQERARVAEAEAVQLRREAAVWRDQNDELDEAKSELLLQGEENRVLKQRLADAQAVAARVRELEVANEQLCRQMEEKDEKVTSLLQKLTEVKERRIMNAEIEKLRWRLKEAEERLAQELQEREAVEAEARNQQSVFQQIRLERRVAEKLRLQQQESTTLLPNGLIQAAADTTGSNNHEDSNPPIMTSFDVSLIDHTSLMPTLPNQASVGENLGSVFQRETERARARISELEHEVKRLQGLSEASTAEVERLTEALAKSSEEANSQETALRLAEDAKLESDCALKRLLDDLDTVEARLAWSASPAASEEAISLASLPSALEIAGQGLAVTRLTDFLLRLSGCVATAWSRKDAALTELRSQCDTVHSRVEELSAELESVLTEKHLASEALAEASETIITLETKLTELQETAQPPQTTSRGNQTGFPYAMADCEVQTIPETLDYDVETSELGTEENGAISSECEEIGSIDTSEALAVDRRNLSGEIVRLHDELKEARDLLESRQLEFNDVMEKLRCSLRDLEYERACSDQARQSWMQCDREARELQNRLTAIEDDFAAQQEALHKILAPVSRFYTHMDPLVSINNLVSDFLAERHSTDERFLDVRAENDRLKRQLLDLQGKLEYEERIRRKLAVLGERSRQLESEAARLRQNAELNNSSRTSISRNFSSPVRHFADDQDTDLDTSEYTDLSQVSWANERPVHKHHRRHTAMARMTPVQNGGDRSCSSSRPCKPPSTRRSDTSNRRTTEHSHHTESSKPKSATNNEPPTEDLLSRVTELRRRNELQPFHLRTTYPVETQLCNPDELLTALKSVHIQRELSAPVTGIDCTESTQPPSSAASTAGSLSPRKTSVPAVIPAGRALKPRGAQSISEVLLTGSSGNVGVQELDLGNVNLLSVDRQTPVSTSSTGTSPLHGGRGLSSSSTSGRLPLVPEVDSPSIAEEGRTVGSSRHSAHPRPSSNHPSREPPRSRSVSSSCDDVALSSTDDQSDYDCRPKQVNKPLAFEVSFSPAPAAPRSRSPPARLLTRTPATSKSSLSQTPSLVLTRGKNSFRPAPNSVVRTSVNAEVASATTSDFKVPGPIKANPVAVASNGKWATPSAVAASNSRRPLKETTSRTNRRT